MNDPELHTIACAVIRQHRLITGQATLNQVWTIFLLNLKKWCYKKCSNIKKP